METQHIIILSIVVSVILALVIYLTIHYHNRKIVQTHSRLYMQIKQLNLQYGFHQIRKF